MKEVNFSDTVVADGEIYRVPGNARGAKWSTIKAHGWFSYELKVRKGETNAIEVELGSYTDTLEVRITLGEKVVDVREKCAGRRTVKLEYFAENCDTVRIKFDKISANTPKIYTVKVK